MIAADTNCLIAYFAGEQASDTALVEKHLGDHNLYLPPVVLAELLSSPVSGEEIKAHLDDIPMLDIHKDYWIRAGRMRAMLRAKGHKAALADTLIAQSCIDHDMPLLTRDRDFALYAKHCGLALA